MSHLVKKGHRVVLKKFDITNLEQYCYKIRKLVSNEEYMCVVEDEILGNKKAIAPYEYLFCGHHIPFQGFSFIKEDSGKTFLNIGIINKSDSDFICKCTLIDEVEYLETPETDVFGF